MKKTNEEWIENAYHYNVRITSYELVLIKLALISKLAEIEQFGNLTSIQAKEFEKLLKEINQIPF